MFNPVDLTDEELAFLLYSTERLELHKFVKEQNFSEVFLQKSTVVENELYSEYRRRAISFKKFLKK